MIIHQHDPEMIAAMRREEVNVERDRRIDAGFQFGEKMYQSRQTDRENISGAATAALAAMMNGAQVGDYLWHGEDTNFVWIASDNTVTEMDAQTVFALGQAAMAHKKTHIFAAFALKSLEVVPMNYADDEYWP